MLKFLFYLFLFYVVYRYIFGGFKIHVYHHNQNNPNQPNYKQQEQEEGRVTINPKVKNDTKDSKGKTDKLGEYVDFEEVK